MRQIQKMSAAPLPLPPEVWGLSPRLWVAHRLLLAEVHALAGVPGLTGAGLAQIWALAG